MDYSQLCEVTFAALFIALVVMLGALFLHYWAKSDMLEKENKLLRAKNKKLELEKTAEIFRKL